MKFTILVAAVLIAGVSALSAHSELGQHLLAHSRQLNNNNQDNAYNIQWTAGFSIKFQGCQNIKQWNYNAEGDEDVKIATQRLIRYRLCPTEACSATKAAGCTHGYADYIIDMDTFMQTYYEARQQKMEYDCQNQRENVCQCGDGNDDGNCATNCFTEAGMDYCLEAENQNDNNNNGQNLDVADYMTCNQVNIQNNNNNNNNNNGNNNDNKYYVGPYCAQQGGEVLLGLFTDDTCTTPADETYEEMTGYALPYSAASVIDDDCFSCLAQNENNNNNNNNGNSGAYPSEACTTLYYQSGKCEENLETGVVDTAENNGCTYMEGIKIVRSDGIVFTGKSRSSAVATAFIVIFAMAFAAMAFYVWYLRTRLGVKQNSLL